jgi:hypothetical protein
LHRIKGCLRGGEAPSFQKTLPLSKSGEGDTGGEVDKQEMDRTKGKGYNLR